MKINFLTTGKSMSRLTILYVAVISSIIGVVILFVSLNNKSIDKYDEISDLSANKLSLLMEMRKNADYIQIQTFKHALDTSLIKMREAGVIIDKENAKNDSIYEAYRKKIKDSKEQELFNKLTAARTANIETRNKLIQIDYDNGPNLREPIHYQQTVQQPKYEAYQDAITALSNYLVNDTNTKIKNVDIYILDSRIIIYGSLIILLILLMVLGNTIKNTLRKQKLQNDELFFSKESIEEQKQFSESILSAAPDGIIGIDDGGAIVIYNKQAENIFGYKAEEIIGKELFLLVPGQFRKNHPRLVEKYFQNPGDRPVSNREAQLFAQRKNGDVFPAEISLSFIDNHHRKIAIAGIKDITKRKETEKRLKQLADINKYSKAFVGISTIDRKIVYMNQSFRNAVGIKPEADISIQSTYMVYPEYRRELMQVVFKEVLDKGLWVGENEMLSADGTIIPVAQTIVLHKDDHGQPEFTSSTMIDITEVKHKEKELIRLNKLHRALGDATRLLLNINTREELYNKICEIVVEIGNLKLAWIGEFNPQTMLVDAVGMGGEARRYLQDITIPVNVPKDKMGPTALALTEGTKQITNDFFATEITHQWQDKAKEFQLAASAVFPIRLYNQVVGTLNVYAATKDYFQEAELQLLEEMATVVSIGALKLEEEKEKLLAEEQKKQLSDIIEQTNALVSMSDMDNNFIYMNKAGKEALGISPNEPLNAINASDIVTPATQQLIIDTVLPALEKNDIWSGEVEMISRNGTVIPAMLVTVQHRDKNGVPTHRSNTTIDITELKQKEKSLKQLTEIIENSNAFIGLSDLNSKFLYLNKNVRKAFDLLPDEKINDLNVFDFHTTPSKEKLTKIGDALRDKGVWTGETEMLSKNGKIIPTLQVIMLHKDKDGNPECYSTTAIDISEIKEKEKGLKQLNEILENSNAFVGIADLNSNLKYLNKSFKDALALDNEEDITTLKITDFHTSNSIKKWGDTIGKSLMEKGFWIGETEMLSKTGKIIPTLQVIMLHKDKNGNPESYSTTAIDISEIKNKENELQKLAGIIEHAPAYAGIAKMDGAIEYMNNSLKTALELDASDTASTLKLFDFLTTDSAKHISEVALQKVMQDGIWQGQSEWKSKNDKTIPVIQSIMLHTNQEGVPEYISTTAIDISEIKEKEKELQKSAEDLRSLYNHLQNIREEERKTIAKELHDELGQNLTALKLNVAWISNHLDGDRALLNERLQLFEKVTTDTVTTSRRLYN
ncbi:MAG: PAS domain S-box protein, partial [Bacteroidota bacterium]